MKNIDTYSNIAEYYDYMVVEDKERIEFFRSIFEQYDVKSVLD